MVAKLVATPDPVPVGTITRIDGSGFINRVTRLKLDGVIVGDSFRATKGIFTVGVLVSSTVKSQTLVAEQKQSGGSWSVVARLAPLLTFGPPGGVDTSPPVVTGLQGNNITSSSFNASFTTNEPSTTVINYGTTTAYLGGTVTSGTLVTAHNATVSGLTASTLYHWRAQTTDSKGNTAITADQTITTFAGGVTDTTAPVLSDPPVVSNITASSATITWTTDDPSTEQVQYGPTVAYGTSTVRVDVYINTTHVVQLNSLTPNTQYHFRYASINASGLVSISTDQIFNTLPSTSYASFQAAVNATATGGQLDLTGQTFAGGGTVNRAMTITGGTLNIPIGQNGISITGSGVTLVSVTVQGPRSTAIYNSSENGIYSFGAYSNLTIRSCTIDGFGNCGIYMKSLTAIDIRDTTITDCGYSGILAYECTNGQIRTCTIERIQPGSAGDGNAYGIDLDQQAGPSCTDWVIDGNIVNDVPTWHGLDTHGGKRITFSNNTVTRCARPIFITRGGVNHDVNAGNVTITGNTFATPLPDNPNGYPNATNVGQPFVWMCATITFTGNTIDSDFGAINNGASGGDIYYNYLRDYTGASTGVTSSGNTEV